MKIYSPKAQDPKTRHVKCVPSHPWYQTAFCLFLLLYLNELWPEMLQDFCIFLLYFFNEVTHGLNQQPRGSYYKRKIYRNRTIYLSI